MEFLDKDKAYSEIVQIVKTAGEQLVLISPYIKLPTDFLDRLKYRDKQGLQTVVVCREKDLKDEQRNELRQLRHLDLRFDDDLHAKCFHNEKSMVITSLNLHEHSQQNNREMGILLGLEDSQVFKEAFTEAEFIVNRAKKDSPLKNLASKIVKEAKSAIYSLDEDTPKRTKTLGKTNKSGACIRCGKGKTYDLDAPYCLDCFRVWNEYKNSDFQEHYCHSCGNPTPTTKDRPLCYSCYKKSSG